MNSIDEYFVETFLTEMLFSSFVFIFYYLVARTFRFTCCLCRSQSRYVDVEKPKKKKTMSATSSLVSIPNTIKLSMLNSGLLSFGKRSRDKIYRVVLVSHCMTFFYSSPASIDKIKLSVKGELMYKLKNNSHLASR